MNDMLGFLWTAFFDYWKLWVTGTGIVGFGLFLISMFERHRGRVLGWKIYGAVLFCAFWFFGTFSAWHDSQKNLHNVIQQRGQDTSDLGRCAAHLQTESALKTSWQERYADQQKTINSFQAPQLQQQATLNSCVVSLGKLNPTITRQVSVITIPIGMREASSNKMVGLFAPHKTYVMELIVTTNETQARPNGDLKCGNAFNIDSPPQLPILSTMAMVGGSIPQRISDREYAIRVENTGSEWGPNSPIYMGISSKSENIGKCTFMPQ